MTKKLLGLLLLAPAALWLTACDDGPVDESVSFTQQGRNVRLAATLTGTDTWPDGYKLALAAFDSESDYALTARTLTAIPADGKVSVALTGIPDEAVTVELCVLNNLRQRIATFASLEGADLLTGQDTIPFAAGDVRMSMFEAVQREVFNTTCVGCHGAGDGAAAGLYLTEGRSHDALVGQPSKKVDGAQLVVPGDPDASVLYGLIATEGYCDDTWHYRHINEINNTRLHTLVRDWIEQGGNN
ncbi:MAG: hypothetical protein J6M53_06540 [Bacteroidaceae bacterium]|nr:hypothetical protein [Bacteroidaceae bacterium]